MKLVKGNVAWKSRKRKRTIFLEIEDHGAISLKLSYVRSLRQSSVNSPDTRAVMFLPQLNILNCSS